MEIDLTAALSNFSAAGFMAAYFVLMRMFFHFAPESEREVRDVKKRR